MTATVTAPAPAAVPPAVPASPADRGSWPSALRVVALLAAVIGALYLSIFPGRGFRTPIGWDSTEYAWRTDVARTVGLANVADAVPPNTHTKEGRPAFLVVASTLESLTGASSLTLTMTVPAAIAAAIALAAGALVSAGTPLPRWGFLVAGFAVGASTNVVLMQQYAYLDNMLVVAVVLAALALIPAAIADRWAVLPVALLLGAAALIHTPFFFITALVLALVAGWYLRSSLRGWRREGRAAFDTPTGRVAGALLGGGAVGAALVLGTTGPPQPRLIRRSDFAVKLAYDVPRYRFPIVLPLAATGIAFTHAHDRWRLRRAGPMLVVLGAWAVVSLGGWLAYLVLPGPIPGNRFLVFGLALPLLAALAVVRAGLWLAGRWRWAAIVAVSVAVLAAAASALWLWALPPSVAYPTMLDQAATAEAYLDAASIRPGRPVVFVVTATPDDVQDVPYIRDHMRDGLDSRRIGDVTVYPGDPNDYLARRPTDDPRFARLSRTWFGRVQPTYAQDPVALIVASTNRAYFAPWVSEHPGSVVGRGVAVVRGPPVAGPVHAPSPVPPRSPASLALLSAGALVFLGAVGLGWTVALRRWLGPLEVLSLTPAVGIAALVVAGTVADRLGLRLTGVTPVLVAAVVAGLGWLAARAARPRT